MLLMGNKLDEQTPQVHLENFLTMVSSLYNFETMAFGSTAMCGGDSFWFWVISSIPFYGATWEQ
ncbi:hypothetical protein Gogos_000704 [Gossypium gossypioides]|uniref:Uncharacterized protein n=1 Tax=Gossypium gossypioides TaxID=34282 RepID=A0A7J9CTK4_GOSGO|nr:hypothetical protein [Gossypium gossypioides]